MTKEKRNEILSAAGLILCTLLLAAVLLRAPAAPADLPAAGQEEANPTPQPGVYWGETWIAGDTRTLSIPGSSPAAEELAEMLSQLPALERLALPDGRYTPAEQMALRERFPAVEFLWPVEVCGKRFASDAEELSFAGREDLTKASLKEIERCAALFPVLKSVDLTGCGLDIRLLTDLDRALGERAHVRWSFDLYGVTVSSLDTEIDLSDHRIKDGAAALEEAIGYMPALERVVMCRCGLTDEEMDALNRRYDDIRFVWMVYVQYNALRTDSDYYTPFKASGIEQTDHPAGLRAFRYCTDLVALDLGHSKISDISYIANMPHLKYLILAECYTLDLSLVGELKELKWLELFQSTTRDLSPLLGCTALEDLNICYITAPRDNLFETLRQMTWLKRLWCSGTTMTRQQIEQLREALPDTEIWCKNGDESTGGTWRYAESYYEMRDAFHMYYMTITGERTRRLDEEELAAVHKKFWGW